MIRDHPSHVFPDPTLGFVIIFSGLSRARQRESGVLFICSEAKHYNSSVVKTHGYSKKYLFCIPDICLPEQVTLHIWFKSSNKIFTKIVFISCLSVQQTYSACSSPSVQHQKPQHTGCRSSWTDNQLIPDILVQSSRAQHCSATTSNLLLHLSLLSPKIIIIHKSAKDCLTGTQKAFKKLGHLKKSLLSQVIVLLIVPIFLFYIKRKKKRKKKHIRGTTVYKACKVKNT